MPASRPRPGVTALTLVTAACIALFAPTPATAQWRGDRVLTRMDDEGPGGALAVDRGAVGLWQRLLTLRTTASVLYVTAHPDDEESGVLTLLARGGGVRTALLTLNRGEGGANALGPELFDALGLLRTEELRLAGRYYGLSDQYFTNAVDYGYSKSLDEAFRSWDRNALLGDMVRVIRVNRPLVVVSRWYGGVRDGHGQHQAAGALTPEAVAAAADPTRFPEQIAGEGLRPWNVLKVYRGNIREDEPWQVALAPGAWSPWLGETYQAFGAEGLALQRSQTAGRTRRGRGSAVARYQRLFPTDGPAHENGLFDGLDTSLPGIFSLLGETGSPEAVAALGTADAELSAAMVAFRVEDPATTADHLAAALTALRAAERATPRESEAAFQLRIEERHLVDALGMAAGVRLDAVAVPQGADIDTPMEGVVPGERFDVHLRVRNGGADSLRLVSGNLASMDGAPVDGGIGSGDIAPGGEADGLFSLVIPVTARPSGPWFARRSVTENRYQVRDSTGLPLAESRSRLLAAATVVWAGVPVTLTAPVRTVEVDAPWGTLRHELAVLPALAVSTTPTVHVLPTGTRQPFDVTVEVAAYGHAPADAMVGLGVPDGWTVTPDSTPVHLSGPGAREVTSFSVTPGGGAGPWTLSAQAHLTGSADPTVYREGFETVRHPDLETRRLYRPASLRVVPVDVRVASGLRVGYVMGVGDQVPAAIQELGARVELLGREDLASGDLTRFDDIVIGTRAYAVRPDLVANTGRLLDWARAGGNLVVLYQTPEFDPGAEAPFPATLPDNPEETSEEDAPVTMLAPSHPLLTTPNRIGPDDFAHWIEQRGSKFFSAWDDAYTPLVETHDHGQEPQRGVWLSAAVGEGHWTYCALALHRQLPYGVPGAYRILANLLSRGR